MDKRQQVLEVVQKIQDDFLEEVLCTLQPFVEASDAERVNARTKILNAIKQRPKSQVPSRKRTWRREDAYE